MTGITRSAAAKIIAEHFGTSAVHVGGTYDTYTLTRSYSIRSVKRSRCTRVM